MGPGRDAPKHRGSTAALAFRCQDHTTSLGWPQRPIGTPGWGRGRYTLETATRGCKHPPTIPLGSPPQMAPVYMVLVGLSITDFYGFFGLSWET